MVGIRHTLSLLTEYDESGQDTGVRNAVLLLVRPEWRGAEEGPTIYTFWVSKIDVRAGKHPGRDKKRGRRIENSVHSVLRGSIQGWR